MPSGWCRSWGRRGERTVWIEAVCRGFPQGRGPWLCPQGQAGLVGGERSSEWAGGDQPPGFMQDWGPSGWGQGERWGPSAPLDQMCKPRPGFAGKMASGLRTSDKTPRRALSPPPPPPPGGGEKRDRGTGERQPKEEALEGGGPRGGRDGLASVCGSQVLPVGGLPADLCCEGFLFVVCFV